MTDGQYVKNPELVRIGSNDTGVRYRVKNAQPGDYVQYGENIILVDQQGYLSRTRVNQQGQPIGTGPVIAHNPRNLTEKGNNSSGPKAPPVPTRYPTAPPSPTSPTIQPGATSGIKFSQPGSVTGGGTTTPSGTSRNETALSARAAILQGEAARQQPGVYVPTQGPLQGKQVIITQGGPKTAGQEVRQLQGQAFTPGRLSGPLNGNNNLIYGIRQANGGIFLGPNAISVTNEKREELYKTNIVTIQNGNNRYNSRNTRLDSTISSDRQTSPLGIFNGQENNPTIIQERNQVSKILGFETGKSFPIYSSSAYAKEAQYHSGIEYLELQGLRVLSGFGKPFVLAATNTPEAIGQLFVGALRINQEPVEVAQEVVTSLYQNPIDTISELAGNIALFHTVSTGVGATAEIFGPTRFTGEVTSPISVEGFGEQLYKGVGEEVNPPIAPELLRTTSYTEKVQGFRGLFNDAKVQIIEDNSGRVVTKYIPETEQTAAYQYSAFTKKNAQGAFEVTPEGTPIETVVITKGGKIIDRYTQPAEGFGKVIVSTAPNVLNPNTPKASIEENTITLPEGKINIITKGEAQKPYVLKNLQETKSTFQSESTRPQSSVRTIDTRTEAYPYKNIAVQEATKEELLGYNARIGNKQLVGKISVGTSAEAVSNAGIADFRAYGTDIRRVFTETSAGTTKEVYVSQPERLLAGKAGVKIQITKGAPENEFVQSINKPTSQNEVYLGEEKNVAIEDLTQRAGRIQKPLIETQGRKTISIAGQLELKSGSAAPKVTVLEAVNTGVGRVANKVEPYIKNPKEFFVTPYEKGKAYGTIPSNTIDVYTGRVVSLEKQVGNNELIPEATATVQGIKTPEVNAVFSVPEGATKTTSAPLVIPLIKAVTKNKKTITPVNQEEQRSNSIAAVDYNVESKNALANIGTTIGQSKIAQLNRTSQGNTITQLGATNLQQEPVSRTENVTSLVNTQVTNQATELTQSQVTNTVNATKQPIMKQEYNFKINQEPIIEKAFPKGSSSKKKKSLVDLLVRRRGKFRPILVGVGLEEAVLTGQSITDTTLAASFEVTEAGTLQPVQGSLRTALESFVNPRQFLPSKRTPDVFVEQARFRLSTFGEKAEIRSSKSNKFRGGSWL